MNNIVIKIIFIADTVSTKGTAYTIGYYVGAWLPFLILAVVVTAIIIKKKKS